jgi:hypothetical protein
VDEIENFQREATLPVERTGNRRFFLRPPGGNGKDFHGIMDLIRHLQCGRPGSGVDPGHGVVVIGGDAEGVETQTVFPQPEEGQLHWAAALMAA